MSRHLRAISDVKRRPHGQRVQCTLPRLRPSERLPKAPLPRLCSHGVHTFRFVDRVQLSLPDSTLGGYALAVYLSCTNCVAVVEFLGVCEMGAGQTRVNSAWLLYPDGRGHELPLPANRVVLTAHG